MPGYCFKFEGYGNGNRSTGVAFSDGRYGGWRVLGLRGSSRNFLDDWFRVGGYFLGDELFFNGAGIGYGFEASFSFKLFVIRSTSSNLLFSNYFPWVLLFNSVLFSLISMSYFRQREIRSWITKVRVFIKLLRASKYKITKDGNLYKFHESSQRFNLLQLLKRNIEEYKWSGKKLRMRSQIDFAGP